MRRTWWIFVAFLLGCSLLPQVSPIPESTPIGTIAVPQASPTPEPPPPTPTPLPPTELPDPASATWTIVTDGLDSPVDIQSAGDDRLFIIEQVGRIRIVASGVLRPEPFLDLSDRVGSEGNEQGLLGLAFHPDFAGNGAFFVNYTDVSGDTVVSRFHVSDDPNRADPSSETVLLTYDQPYANHNGGGLAFGPDGYLYIGSGDGGSGGDPEQRAQNRDSLLGKLLRVDVDGGSPYALPPDNPFASGGGRPEIWSYGLRNPWRFTFDPATGDLYLGDVGQGDWEEVDFLAAGSPGGTNFGWDFREGLHDYEGRAPEGLTDPVAEYSHDEGGCSITAGRVVRDPDLPAWQGVFLYGDFCTGYIWGLLRDDSGAWRSARLFETGLQITSFGTGSAGEIYVLDRGGGPLGPPAGEVVQGQLYRLSPTS